MGRLLSPSALAAPAAAVALGLLATAPAAHARSADVAALQVALRAVGLYSGDVDGLRGSGTANAVRAFQRGAGLAADGVPGPRTRRLLGRRGRPRYGSRVMVSGDRGWDVSGLQFKLALHGCPSGTFDGGLGARTASALVRFQRRAGVEADGAAGPATLRALRARPPRSPLRLVRPVRGPVGDRFGPRGDRFHAGLDFPVPAGRPVAAARNGVVTSAGWLDSGWGHAVIIDHGLGVRTLYAHLSAVLVGAGARVRTGRTIGRVGATGFATGPHLHFEVTVRGANVNPRSALG